MRDNKALNTIFDSAQKVNQERRKYTRVNMCARVKMVLDDEVIEGELINISLNGAFVVFDKPVQVNSTVTISIFDAINSRSLPDINARVVRAMGNGVGLQFTKPAEF